MNVETWLYNVEERISYIIRECYRAEWRFILSPTSTQILIYLNVFLFFQSFHVWQSLGSNRWCSGLFLCLHFEELWKCCSWLFEPGNLGICKVSTITEAISLGTIMKSREEEYGKTGKATRKPTRARKEKRGWTGWNDAWSSRWGVKWWGPRPQHLCVVCEDWELPLCCVSVPWPTNSRLMAMAKTYDNGAARNSAIGDTSNVRSSDSSEITSCLHI